MSEESTTDYVLLAEIEWAGGGYEGGSLDYYDDGQRASGFCPRCEAPQSRGHHPWCEIAFYLKRKTVTDKQAAAAVRRREKAAERARQAEKAKREAEWQAYLDTLTPEERAEEERKRALQLECARALTESMEKAFLFGAEPSPLTKLLGMSQKSGKVSDIRFDWKEEKP